MRMLGIRTGRESGRYRWRRLILLSTLVFTLIAGAIACSDDGNDDETTTTALAVRSPTVANTNSGSGDQTQDSSATAPSSDPSNGNTPLPGATPSTNRPTPPPVATVPPGQVATLTLDSNPDTDSVEHDELRIATGQPFTVALTINDPSGSYVGYQYGVKWREPQIAFVSEEPLNPAEMTLCPEASDWRGGTGKVGGCLRLQGETDFAGRVARITLRCASAGDTRIELISRGESPAFGAALLEIGGTAFADEVDEGLRIICT